MENKSIEFLKSYCQFEKNWVWILTGIARNKDNENSEKFLRRFVIKSHDDIEHSYHCLKEMMNKEGVTYRMYISLNARDTLKTLFNFQHTLVALSFDIARGIDNGSISNIDSLWKTELAQSSNRATKRFLLDIDNFKNGRSVMDLLAKHYDDLVNVHALVETPSGLACVIDAIDTRGLEKEFKDAGIEMTIQKDSMVFLEQFTA